MAETDNPWKTALDGLFPLAMAFFLPEDAAAVEWTRTPESLETELRPMLPATQTGLKYVDKLVKLWRKQTVEGEILESGTEEEDYYHFEFQYQKDDGFEKRMSDYNDVARVHLHQHVVSVAILGDEDAEWNPEVYRWAKSGCELIFRFRLIKLLKWRGKEDELLAHENPFALFVLSHLLILPTEDDEEARAAWKLRLWQKACEHKMEEQDRNTLSRVIDWMLLLPRDRNKRLLQQFEVWREENRMPFVSVFEQEILDQRQQLREKDQQLRDRSLRAIAMGLRLKFKEEGQALFAEVEKQTDLDWLGRFLDRVEAADSLDDLRKLLP
jgi:hypothetical protein